MEELINPGNDKQCWWPGCTQPRIQPSGEDHDTRGWKVCDAHFCQGIHWLWDQFSWPQQPCGADECVLKPKKEVKDEHEPLPTGRDASTRAHSPRKAIRNRPRNNRLGH